MLKIHILGAPGSGKTTLANILSSKFHTPHYDLEEVGCMVVPFVKTV